MLYRKIEIAKKKKNIRAYETLSLIRKIGPFFFKKEKEKGNWLIS